MKKKLRYLKEADIGKALNKLNKRLGGRTDLVLGP